jgi:hypothetical protein
VTRVALSGQLPVCPSFTLIRGLLLCAARTFTARVERSTLNSVAFTFPESLPLHFYNRWYIFL